MTNYELLIQFVTRHLKFVIRFNVRNTNRSLVPPNNRRGVRW